MNVYLLYRTYIRGRGVPKTSIRTFIAVGHALAWCENVARQAGAGEYFCEAFALDSYPTLQHDTTYFTVAANGDILPSAAWAHEPGAEVPASE